MFAYLQLYQCLEYLFVIYHADTMMNKYNISHETAVKIILDNSVRNSEKDTLESVIKNYATQFCLDNLAKIIHDSNATDETIHAHIYTIRCAIAHLRFMQKNTTQTYNWETEIGLVLELIANIYSAQDEMLAEIANKNNIFTQYNFTYERYRSLAAGNN